MLAQDWPKSHGMTTVFKDYVPDYDELFGTNELIAVERALDISASVCVNLRHSLSVIIFEPN